MGRRKRVLDDSDSDSSVDSGDVDDGFADDPDSREERALFEDPYKRKRRRTGGKEEALYGIFAEDMEDETPRTTRNDKGKRTDWAKAPAFVSGEKVDLEKDLEIDEDRSEGEDENEEEPENDSDDDGGSGPGCSRESSTSQPTRAVVEDAMDTDDTVRAALDEVPAAPGLSSFAKRGLGFTSKSAAQTHTSDDTTPSAFGKSAFAARASMSFQPAKPAVALPANEMAHFSKLQGSFGARMLSKMGWSAGTGLGVTGEGIVTPIESKLRPQKMGIAFKGFKEKTDQSKMEAKRKGEIISDDEEESKPHKDRRKGQTSNTKRSDVWKKPKKAKIKVQHKTYEEIIAEAGEEPSATGIGMIIDATGAVPREVSSLADVSVDPWAPSNDPTRIPEVRHNLRLISDVCKSDLEGLAREGKTLAERKKWINSEDARLRKQVAEEANLIERLQRIHLVVDNIQVKAKELSSMYEPSLDPFSPLFCQLLEDFSKEYNKYHLDEIVVAAITPLVRRMASTWDPLHDPSYFVTSFRTWKQALRVHAIEEPPLQQIDVYGAKTISSRPNNVDSEMTPFESLLWNVIVPRIRSSINNEWSPESPQAAVRLLETWSTFWPPFIRDNFLDQLILPKVHKAVGEWNPHTSAVSLRSIVFPWLPFVGLRLEDVLGDARRKIKSVLRNWAVEEQQPPDLAAWKEMFEVKEWDALMLKFVVPKLGASLRTDFRINPRDQKMEPLLRVLAWSSLLRSSILSQILESEFFPKWLDILHVWLTQPKTNFEEVTQWYVFWKGTFPEDVQALAGVSRGFTCGLQLMNKAIELGPDAQHRLPRPDFKAASLEGRSGTSTPSRAHTKSRLTASRVHEVTFRSIVEEFAATHNLLLLPSGKTHEKSRMPLFRISPSVSGKGGLNVYILDDAVWAQDLSEKATPGDYRAITLEDMVLRANA